MARQIESLTGLRGIAAIAVVVHHVNVFVAGGDIVLRGQPFVDLFFVLSGFVISLAYLKPGSRRFDWSGFFRARFARIYPLHLVTTLAMAAALAMLAYQRGEPLDERYSAMSALRELTLLGAMPMIAAERLWNYPSWSISVEWWTYFTVFALILWLRGSCARTLAIGFCVLACGVGIGLYHFDPTRVFIGWPAFLRAAVGFGLGWVVWEIWRRGAQPVRAGYPLALLAAMLVAIYAIPAMRADDHDAWLLLPLYPLLIYALANADRQRRNLLNTRSMVWLGEISYSIYLVHPLVLLLLQTLHPRLAAQASRAEVLVIESVVALAATIPMAAMTYALIEKPARQWLTGRADSRIDKKSAATNAHRA
jgi:peptidoglycan/LPS O-acetylase OafA/YrhL